MARLNLLSPWMKFYNELCAFFREDPEVNVVYDDSGDTDKIKLYVNNAFKAEALTALLPSEKTFGVITILIEVIPSNKIENTQLNKYQKVMKDTYSLLQSAFENNDALSFVQKVEGIFANTIIYVVFKNKVVQYYDDSLSDIYGQCSTLYQEIAKNIFEQISGVYYCTDKSVAITNNNMFHF